MDREAWHAVFHGTRPSDLTELNWNILHKHKIFQQSKNVSFFSTASPAFNCLKFLTGHSDQCVMVHYCCFILHFSGFPCGANGKEPTCQCMRLENCRFNPWFGKISWRRKWQPTPVVLPGELHGQRSLAGCIPWVVKSWTGLSDWACTQRLITLTKLLHIDEKAQLKIGQSKWSSNSQRSKSKWPAHIWKDVPIYLLSEKNAN